MPCVAAMSMNSPQPFSPSRWLAAVHVSEKYCGRRKCVLSKYRFCPLQSVGPRKRSDEAG